MIALEPSDRGQEAAIGILGIEARLNSPPCQFDVLLSQRQLGPSRDPDHLLDKIETGDQLGHGMFDLKPGIHFEKIEIPVCINDEFHRSGAVVVDRLGQCHSFLAHRFARRLVDEGRRGFFEDFLVAALNGTFAFAQVDDIAVLVAEDLDLDVPWRLDELLDEDALVAKTGFGFTSGRFEAIPRFGRRIGDTHALPAPAC